jgi:hypothetical protein
MSAGGSSDAVTIDTLPLESYADLPDDAICIVCQQPSVDNVIMCLTGHNCCRTCADRWARSDNDNSDKCPSCRGPLHRPQVSGRGNVWVTNTVLNNLVDTMQLKCPHKAAGCTHTCKLNEMTDHIKTCEWREVSCRCAGCDWKGPICQRDAHMRDIDHGRFFIEALLATQAQVEQLAERFDGLEEKNGALKTDFIDPLKLQLSCFATGQNLLQSTLTSLEQKAKWNDGSSGRTARRDRKTQKDIDAANGEVERIEAEKQLVVVDRDTLKRKVDELEARPEPSPFVSEDLHTQACDSRDRYFRERDEARHEAHLAQQRIHDQHTMLKKMMPQATGTCPCALDRCDAGGGSHNFHIYRRASGPHRAPPRLG